jgi:3-oxoadipate enol-lactonase
MWQDQLVAFSADFEVLTPALGDTDPGGGFTVGAAADRIADLIAGLRGGRAAVCGISLGAFVALQLAADHPSRVSALVLSGGQAHPPRLPLRLTSWLLRAAPSRLAVADGGSKPALLESYRTLRKWDARDRLSAVTAPTLIVCGSRDRANLPAARALAAGIDGARSHVVPGAGHLWNLSHGPQFDAVVGGFLRQTAGPGGGISPADGAAPAPGTT